MADFMTKLWESVFTPGPTPTLLVATNLSFAALELVLLVLLAATYSIHFLVLSLLSGALWWAINWFATELLEVQRQEEQSAKRSADSRKQRDPRESLQSLDSSTEDEGVATAVSDSQDLKKRKPPPREQPAPKEVPLKQEMLQAKRPSVGDGLSEMSGTEDEWEKISGSGILEK